MPKHDLHEKLATAPDSVTILDVVKYFDTRLAAFTSTARMWILGTLGVLAMLLVTVVMTLSAGTAKVATDLQEHKEKAGIHRSPEEVAAKDKADAEFKEYVKESLQRIERKVDRSTR